MNSYITAGLLLFLYMTTWFFIALAKKRNDVADIAWGGGFVLLSWFTFTSAPINARSLIVCVLVTLWGLRLATHIFFRNEGLLPKVRGLFFSRGKTLAFPLQNTAKSEDFRYKAWRDAWGKWFSIRTYLQVFLLQGFFLYLIAFSTLFINFNSKTGLFLLDYLGILVWCLGFFFESIGDYQLNSFITNPDNKGKILQSGLWKYSRHPNYFGEVCMWWGVFIIALSVPNGWLTIISPLTITTLILFVSGIPLLENKYVGNPQFEEYKSKTSVFFPLPPKL